MKLVAAIIIFTLCVQQATAQRFELPKIAAMEKKTAARQFAKQEKSAASNNYKVHYYQCVWRVNPAVNYITGKVTAHFIITQPTNNIVFDLTNNLTVDSVLIHNNKISFQQASDETLNLRLPTSYAKDQQDSVTIYYQGVPPSANEAFVQTNHASGPIIWTLSEPYGAKDWWPCRNGLDDKADSIDVYIIHPSQYKSTSNGLLQSETTVNNTTTTFYKHRYPIASYLVAFAVSNYSVFTQQVQMGNNTMPVISYVYPESLASFQSATYLMIQAMQVYYNAFGDYPFVKEKYGHTQFGYGGGMEHQTNSFISSPGQNLMAHELGHQWFGDKVTCGSWHDIWLNEGFAEYLADILYTEKSGSSYYKAFIDYDLNGIVAQPGGSVYVDDTTSVNRIFDERLTYQKGAFLLRMLRWTLGDSAFFNGLRNYLNDPVLQYSFARTSDLQRHLEETGNTSLTYFFNQWFYGQGYPSFKVKWQQNINNFATVNISQVTSDASVSFFKVPLALTFKNSTKSKTFVVGDSTADFETILDIGFAADTVLIDPDKQLISKNNTTVKLPAETNAVNDITVYPNPFNGQILIDIKNPVEKKWQVALYNVQGKKLLERTFDTPGADAVLQVHAPLNAAAGIYFLKLDAGDIHLVKKLVRVNK